MTGLVVARVWIAPICSAKYKTFTRPLPKFRSLNITLSTMVPARASLLTAYMYVLFFHVR